MNAADTDTAPGVERLRLLAELRAGRLAGTARAGDSLTAKLLEAVSSHVATDTKSRGIVACYQTASDSAAFADIDNAWTSFRCQSTDWDRAVKDAFVATAVERPELIDEVAFDRVARVCGYGSNYDPLAQKICEMHGAKARMYWMISMRVNIRSSWAATCALLEPVVDIETIGPLISCGAANLDRLAGGATVTDIIGEVAADPERARIASALLIDDADRNYARAWDLAGLLLQHQERDGTPC